MRHVISMAAGIPLSANDLFNLKDVRHTRTFLVVQTVLETGPFVSHAKAAGMPDEEREALVDHLAANPMAGEKMEGTGGCRKFRYKKPGKGKSGSYRVVSFFGGSDIPVVLLTVFGKGEKDNLTKAERNALKKLVEKLEVQLRNYGK